MNGGTGTEMQGAEMQTRELVPGIDADGRPCFVPLTRERAEERKRKAEQERARERAEREQERARRGAGEERSE